MKSLRLADDDYRRADRLLARRDPVLKALIRAHGPCKLGHARHEDPFVALVQAIVWQQLSGKAAATIYGRVLALLPGGTLTPAHLLAIPEDRLRAAGLSRAKIAYIRDLSTRVMDGHLHLDTFETFDDEAVIAELTGVKGIGRWTAEMFLMFRLQRADVLPVADVGIVNAMKRAYGLRKAPSPVRMRKIAEAWRPYRSIGCWYMWCSLDDS